MLTCPPVVSVDPQRRYVFCLCTLPGRCASILDGFDLLPWQPFGQVRGRFPYTLIARVAVSTDRLELNE